MAFTFTIISHPLTWICWKKRSLDQRCHPPQLVCLHWVKESKHQLLYHHHLGLGWCLQNRPYHHHLGWASHHQKWSKEGNLDNSFPTLNENKVVLDPFDIMSPLSPLSPPSPFAKTDGGSLKWSKKSSNLGGKVKIHLRAAKNSRKFRLIFFWGVVVGSRGVKCLQ